MECDVELFADRLLYYCPDKIQLQKGVNDLKVSCRIVTFRGALTQLGVRTIAMSGKNYTINAELSEIVGHTSEKTLQEDRRFVLSVVRGQVRPFVSSVDKIRPVMINGNAK